MEVVAPTSFMRRYKTCLRSSSSSTTGASCGFAVPTNVPYGFLTSWKSGVNSPPEGWLAPLTALLAVAPLLPPCKRALLVKTVLGTNDIESVYAPYAGGTV